MNLLPRFLILHFWSLSVVSSDWYLEGTCVMFALQTRVADRGGATPQVGQPWPRDLWSSDPLFLKANASGINLISLIEFTVKKKGPLICSMGGVGC